MLTFCALRLVLSNKKSLYNGQNWSFKAGFLSFWTRIMWLLVVVDRWPLFRGKSITKIAWAGFRGVVVDRCQFLQRFYVGFFRTNVVSADFSSYTLALASKFRTKNVRVNVDEFDGRWSLLGDGR